MRVQIRSIFIALSFLLLLLSYQNCSVYKSDGRKLLEQEGTSPEDNITVSNKLSQSADNCAPLLRPVDIYESLQSDLFEMKLYSNQIDPPTCLITQYFLDAEITVSYACKLSYQDLKYFNSPIELQKYADPHPSGPTQNGSFAIVQEKENQQSLIRFMGIGENKDNVIVCTTLTDNKDLSSKLEEQIKKLSDFVHKIEDNLN